MHEGEIFDIRHVASFGPNTHVNVRQVLLQRPAPSPCGANVLIEADDEQRHEITERFGPQCAADRDRTPLEFPPACGFSWCSFLLSELVTMSNERQAWLGIKRTSR